MSIRPPQPLRVTFVGVGAIGLPMAQQVAQAGHAVTGVDPSPERRTLAAEHGLVVEEIPSSAAEADAVVVMVATPDQLHAAALGEQGLLARMRQGTTLIVMSTVGPEPVRALEAPAAEHGVRLLDVPVTGGVGGAQKGALRLFASGAADVLEDSAELLGAMGTVVGCGDQVGRGQAFKAVNQLLCSVHIVAAAEALALAERLGLEQDAVLEAVSSGAAGSWMLADRGPRMLEGLDAEVRSAVGIFVKDSGMVAEIAGSLGLDAPLLHAAQAKYVEAADAGLIARDDSQVIQTYR
ncbi:NAD(P)-dependent oxidoreductase [Nesterenkonia xinjiangensis]|uniref:3-hydroxyisobutyrate dehydrogenase n=1 Tax=Nesterenkonia xinjiangensis TaxID=225327 RepID=A0A7Z0GN22_9MICC|nr:NAD(P)-dependent oxidoreductase [Nesterenkonia xinjiangensis]NYJ78504.1 3-hydroxyisobutyrate dehydrogenase [Nesterenkonia xinjiangensis]